MEMSLQAVAEAVGTREEAWGLLFSVRRFLPDSQDQQQRRELGNETSCSGFVPYVIWTCYLALGPQLTHPYYRNKPTALLWESLRDNAYRLSMCILNVGHIHHRSQGP